MSLDPTEDDLRRALAVDQGDADDVRRHKLGLEQRLLAQYDARSVGRSRPRWALAAKLAAAAALVGVATVAACQIPVEMDVPVGARVNFELDPEAGHETLLPLVRELEAELGTDELEVRVQVERRSGDGEQPAAFATIDILTADIPFDVIEVEVEEVFPNADIEPLTGRVRTTLGRRIEHDVFERALDAETLDEARDQLLEELAARGLTAVSVEATEDEHGRHVHVRANNGQADGEGDETTLEADLVEARDGMGVRREVRVEVEKSRHE